LALSATRYGQRKQHEQLSQAILHWIPGVFVDELHRRQLVAIHASLLMVIVARWFLTLCPIPSQFGIPVYLGRLKDRTRLQMVAEVGISETTLSFSDIPSRVLQLLLGNGLFGKQAI
jgi:hypothetical protein